MKLKRRKDLEAELPRSFRRGGDKPRVYEGATGELLIVVGARRKTEAEIERMAAGGLVMRLLATPAVGGVQ